MLDDIIEFYKKCFSTFKWAAVLSVIIYGLGYLSLFYNQWYTGNVCAIDTHLSTLTALSAAPIAILVGVMIGGPIAAAIVFASLWVIVTPTEYIIDKTQPVRNAIVKSMPNVNVPKIPYQVRNLGQIASGVYLLFIVLVILAGITILGHEAYVFLVQLLTQNIC